MASACRSGPKRVEPSKSLLGTVHVAGGGYLLGICACGFLPFRLGDPAVAEKDGDRRQGAEDRRNQGLRDSSAMSSIAIQAADLRTTLLGVTKK